MLLAVVGSMLVMFSAASCHAGILMPAQVTFDADDLEKAIDSASTAGASSASQSAQTGPRRIARDWWSDEHRDQNSPLELAKSNLPTGSTSSSTSSSPAGGAPGSGGVVCMLSASLDLRDDSPLGQLAEDHGFSLPDPPGTDLLRPPRL
jgi:hypothetical protein